MIIADTTMAPTAAQLRTPEKTLNTACHEFEGLLLGNILKQGIVPKANEDDDEDQGSSNSALMTEFAAEQTARSLSNSDVTGLANQLKRQMSTPGTCHGKL